MKNSFFFITIIVSILFQILSYYILNFDVYLKVSIIIAAVAAISGLIYTMDCIIIPWREFNKKIAITIGIIALIFASPHIYSKLIEL